MNLNKVKNADNVTLIKHLTAEQLCWELFSLTGEIRSDNLCKSLENFNENQKIFENKTDREL